MAGTGEVAPLGWHWYAGMGGVWFVTIMGLSWADIRSDAVHLGVAGLFFALFGALCWWNGRRCGALHCRVSGYGYGAVALVAFAGAAGWLAVGQGGLMGLFVAVFALSYGAERFAEGRLVA